MLRFNGLDTLMSNKGITDSVTFNAYLKEVLSKRESQGENLEGFVWDAPQIDFTYEMLEAEKTVEVMASYVDLNSPALPAGKKTELVKLTGSIPRMKYAVARGENDYRKQLIMLNEVKSVAAFTNKSESVAVSQFLSKELFYAVDEIAAAIKNSLNYQVGQMKSTSMLTLTDTNNPRGSIRATFSAQVPADHVTLAKWFTKAGAEKAGTDPVKDLRNFIRELRWKANGYENIAVEINEKFLYKLFSHSAVTAALGYAATGVALRANPDNADNAAAVGAALAFEVQKETFRKLIEADELISNKTQCGIEKWNSSAKRFERTLVNAFEEDVVLVRPTGTIGVIKNVVPLRPDGQAIVGDLYGGRGIIEYNYNRDTREQRWQGELTALAVLTRPNDMYYFKGSES